MLAPNVALTILGIDPYPFSAFLFIVLILIVSLIALALLARFPSLRFYRTKKSIIFCTVVVLVLISLVLQVDNLTRRALISYGVEADYRLYPETVNQLNITCINGGGRSCSFYMIIRSVNASFPAQNHPNYVQVSSIEVKVLFTLSERGGSMNAVDRNLFFNIDKNVTGFSFAVFPESWSSATFVSAMGTHFNYAWNETETCYKSGIWQGFQA